MSQATAKAEKTAIQPTRAQNYPEWYQQVIKAADLAENSSVRGCMVIKPWGYAIWERMQAVLDKKFKETGHTNAYFPLFIPKSYLEREAEHIDGFAKECAVVTHTRLQATENGLEPASPLEEPLVVRPTSETIIGESFSKWIQSHRDLPLLINQWANVVRWEKRTRLFLRSSEFLWQEGHTAHATHDEAQAHALKMLHVYNDFQHNTLAIPTLVGEKSDSERFPGALRTFCIEAMMQDKKALQAGTSHALGQNFSKSFDIQFQNDDGSLEHAWTTSFGCSTRMVGGLIMTHSDDNGLVLPPHIAPQQIVLLPVSRSGQDNSAILDGCQNLIDTLHDTLWEKETLRATLDSRDLRGGEKTWQWIKKGIPLRIELGPRDLESQQVVLYRRDKSPKEKEFISISELPTRIPAILEEMQSSLYQKAIQFRDSNIKEIDDKEDFYGFFEKEPQGFAYTHWNGSAKIEEQLQNDLQVTIRCIPLEENRSEPGICAFSGEPSTCRVYFAKSY